MESVRLAELLFKFLINELKLDPKSAAETLWRDWQRAGRTDPPDFLRQWIEAALLPSGARLRKAGLKRQARHLGGPATMSEVKR